MTAPAPAHQPLLSAPLYGLLSLGLGFSIVVAGLGMVILALLAVGLVVGSLGNGQLLFGVSVALLMGLMVWVTALYALGFSRLRRALAEAQQAGPFWGGTILGLREGGRKLLVAGVVSGAASLLLFLLAAVWGRGLEDAAPVLAQAASPAEMFPMLIGSLLAVALPLLLLGLADWLEKGHALRQAQREVV